MHAWRPSSPKTTVIFIISIHILLHLPAQMSHIVKVPFCNVKEHVPKFLQVIQHHLTHTAVGQLSYKHITVCDAEELCA